MEERLFKNILLDKPFKVKVEQIPEFENSFLRDVYVEAAENTLKIINDTDEVHGNDPYKGSEIDFYNDIKDYNNVIAFTGDRGVGKTSAMVSFTKALINLPQIKENDLMSFQKLKNSGYRFTCLKLIEPSNFVKGERLFEIVVANMFRQLSDLFHEKSRIVDKNEVKNIYKLLDEVYSALKAMYSDKKELLNAQNDIGSGLEALEQLAIGENLKKSFDKLVYEYLRMHAKYVFNISNEREIESEVKRFFLIIPIDDIDMNMDNGFEMAEEIRKYLVTKNIIVTMAINIGQFTKIVEQEYIKGFKELVDKGLMNIAGSSDMAVKYITKFIPTNRRISLPSFDVHSIANIKDRDNNRQEVFLADYFLERIYKTTGILLLKNDSKSHEILPTNLREINYLNQILKEMEEVIGENECGNILYKCWKYNYDTKYSYDNKKKLGRNLEKFEDYLIKNYINSDMPRIYSNILIELIKQPSENINKYLVRALIGRDDDTTEDKKVITSKNENDKNYIIMEITSPYSLPQNISIGDVLFILHQLIIQKSDYMTKRFVAGVKIIYSIRMLRHIFIDRYAVNKARCILGEFLYNTEDSMLIRGKRDMIRIPNVTGESYIKSLLENCLFNFLVSRYANIETNYQRKPIRRTAYQDNYFPTYEYSYYPGATDNIVVNLTSFILNLLDTDIINNRLKNSSISINIPEEYTTWREDYIAVIPLWSIDFIELLFKRIPREAELKESSRENKNEYFIYIEKFLNAISRIIGSIIDENAYLKASNLLEAYTENPVLSPKRIKDSVVKDVIEQLGKWYKGEMDINGNDDISEETNNKNKSTSWPIKIKIFGRENDFTSWTEVLTTVIGKLCDQNSNNYELIKQSPELKQLEIGPSESGTGKRKKLKSQKVSDQYIRTGFKNPTVIEFCKWAMKITGNNECDFEVLKVK